MEMSNCEPETRQDGTPSAYRLKMLEGKGIGTKDSTIQVFAPCCPNSPAHFTACCFVRTSLLRNLAQSQVVQYPNHGRAEFGPIKPCAQTHQYQATTKLLQVRPKYVLPPPQTCMCLAKVCSKMTRCSSKGTRGQPALRKPPRLLI